MPDSQLPETPDATPEQGSHVQQPDAVQDAVQFEVRNDDTIRPHERMVAPLEHRRRRFIAR